MVVRLGSWLPFGPAAQLFTAFTKVAMSESTVRRLTVAAGAAQVAQQERAVAAMEGGQQVERDEIAEKLAFAVDGAMVPLIGGEWREARTLVIGEVMVKGNHKGEQVLATENLSYFSRMMAAQSFERAALAETERRGLCQARQAALLGDGAEWIQSFADYHRPDARRILDFAHASERFTTIQERCTQAGVELDERWAEERRKQLKGQGGAAVLATLQVLQEQHLEVDLTEPVTYLSKREALLRYPQFQEEGWPIGSGMVESANKLVVEARLKGAGMHWHPDNVNPMLALRNVVCNNRWEATWPTITQQLRQRPRAGALVQLSPPPADPNRVRNFFRQVQKQQRAWDAAQRADDAPAPKQRWKPAPDHPWRRYAHKP
jgi:hypothetical protein